MKLWINEGKLQGAEIPSVPENGYFSKKQGTNELINQVSISTTVLFKTNNNNKNTNNTIWELFISQVLLF